MFYLNTHLSLSLYRMPGVALVPEQDVALLDNFWKARKQSFFTLRPSALCLWHVCTPAAGNLL